MLVMPHIGLSMFTPVFEIDYDERFSKSYAAHAKVFIRTSGTISSLFADT